jgi:endonuclease/exonuclease/phosphatase family metal-dependent hydrolase
MTKKTITWICLILLSVTGLSAKEKKQSTLLVSSFNLRMDTPNDGEHAWPNRKELVKDLIRFHELDLIGTQEGFKHMLDGILELGNYAYTGVGRNDGKEEGEHSAIIYKKDRFDLLQSGDFWFSETPEIPGKGWDATCCNRICSWAKFKDKETGKVFFMFSLHYDHQGQVARKNSSLLLIDRIKKIAGDSPVIVTGDFNATPDSEPIQLIYDSNLLNDSYLVSEEPPYGTIGTYNGYNINSPTSERIDYIWVTPQITIKKYGTLNEVPNGKFPSDHYPIMVKAVF